MTTRYNSAHEQANLKGPGDARPTAQQIIDDNDLRGKLTDKVFFVTGTSSGIGIHTVAALKSTGAKVYATARNLDKARTALKDILEPGKVELLQLDTGDFSSVRACAKEFLSKESRLNQLINNAGVMAIPTRTLTKDGFEEQFEVNYLGHFLLFQLLKDALLAAATPSFPSKVINVASSGHRQAEVRFDDYNFDQKDSYSGWAAYGQAKTAEIYMTSEITRRYAGQNLHGVALNPGGIDTGLQVHVQEMIDNLKKNPEVMRHMKSPEQGAATTIVAALDRDMEGKGQIYLHDCAVQEVTESKELGGGGYAVWIDDKEKAQKTWDLGVKLVGTEA